MLREGDINDISDGKLYTLNDMVRADVRTAPDALPAAAGWVIPLC